MSGRHRRLMAAIVVIIAVTLVALLWSWHRGDQQDDATSGGHGRSAPASPPEGSRLVANARWQPTPQGYQLRVRPTALGRLQAFRSPPKTLAQALRAAGPTPLPIPPSMRASLVNQLRCHTYFAVTKPSWDLETWRPDVGYLSTVLARCNPS